MSKRRRVVDESDSSAGSGQSSVGSDEGDVFDVIDSSDSSASSSLVSEAAAVLCYRCGIGHNGPRNAIVACLGSCLRVMHISCNDAALSVRYGSASSHTCDATLCIYCNEGKDVEKLPLPPCDCNAPCCCAVFQRPIPTATIDIVRATYKESPIAADTFQRRAMAAKAMVARHLKCHPLPPPVIEKPYVAAAHTVTSAMVDELEHLVATAPSLSVLKCARRDINSAIHAQNMYADCYTRHSKSTYSR